MSSKNPGQRLRDLIENIDAIRDFVVGMTFPVFKEDRKTLYAVTRALEIISEASRRLPEEMKGKYPHLDWQAIAPSGNVYRHEYEAVAESLIWYTIQNSL